MLVSIIVNEKNIVVGYGEVLFDGYKLTEDATNTEVDESILEELCLNYKLENGQLVELTEEEKEANRIDNLPLIKTNEELTKENEQLWETVEFLLKNTGFIPSEEV